MLFLSQLYGMGFIGGFCHLYIGQEAVVTGMKMALVDGDQMITAYRDHGHMLAMELSPRGVMAELTGRRRGRWGTSRGVGPVSGPSTNASGFPSKPAPCRGPGPMSFAPGNNRRSRRTSVAPAS